MPFQKPAFEGEAPKTAHLALMVGPTEALAIPPGAKLFIVTDPERADRIIPVYLAKVTRRELVFRCNCSNPKCTRVLKYQLKVEGFHPAREEGIKVAGSTKDL